MLFRSIGLFLKRFGIPPGPVVLGLILGGLAEGNLRRALEIGGPANILTSPIALGLLAVSALALIVPPIRNAWRARRARSAESATTPTS